MGGLFERRGSMVPNIFHKWQSCTKIVANDCDQRFESDCDGLYVPKKCVTKFSIRALIAPENEASDLYPYSCIISGLSRVHDVRASQASLDIDIIRLRLCHLEGDHATIWDTRMIH